MPESHPHPAQGPSGGAGVFATTQWSLVLRAGGDAPATSSEALEELCRRYWYPLYAFARRSGLSVHDAEDSTQGFFAHLVEKSVIARADPARGRFRSFLLSSFRNFMGQARLRASARKRGGGSMIVSFDDPETENRYQRESASQQTAEQLFERRWAVTLVVRVLRQLETEQQAAGRGTQFTAMKPYLAADRGEATYASLASQLGCSPGAARVAVHRLRRSYHQLFQTEVMQTVGSEEDFKAEVAHLLAVLSS